MSNGTILMVLAIIIFLVIPSLKDRVIPESNFVEHILLFTLAVISSTTIGASACLYYKYLVSQQVITDVA